MQVSILQTVRPACGQQQNSHTPQTPSSLSLSPFPQRVEPNSATKNKLTNMTVALRGAWLIVQGIVTGANNIRVKPLHALLRFSVKRRCTTPHRRSARSSEMVGSHIEDENSNRNLSEHTHPLTDAHSLTHSLTHSLNHSITHSRTHAHTYIPCEGEESAYTGFVNATVGRSAYSQENRTGHVTTEQNIEFGTSLAVTHKRKTHHAHTHTHTHSLSLSLGPCLGTRRRRQSLGA